MNAFWSDFPPPKLSRRRATERGVVGLRWAFIGWQVIVMGFAVLGFARHTRTRADVAAAYEVDQVR